jgi:hypothetical protein
LNLSPALRANNTKRQRLPAGERHIRCPRPTVRRCAIGMPRTCSRAFRECTRLRSLWARPSGAAMPTTSSPTRAFRTLDTFQAWPPSSASSCPKQRVCRCAVSSASLLGQRMVSTVGANPRRPQMYARLVEIQVASGKMDECITIFRDHNAPSIAAQPGFDHGHWFVDRTTGKAFRLPSGPMRATSAPVAPIFHY